jgi:hypothetical protein
MKRIPIEIDSNNDQELIEAVTSLHQITLADDTVECQICNEAITYGNEVVCHLVCPSGTTRYDLAQFRCTAHADSVTELLTLGADELVIAGRIGRCSDQQTDQSWLVLLVPRLRLVSAASTTTAREIDTQPYASEEPPLSPPDDDLEVDIQPRNRIPVVADDVDSRETATLSRWADTDTGGES